MIPTELKNRKIFYNTAARKREMYLIKLFSRIHNVESLYFITPAYGGNGGFHKLIKQKRDNINYFFLGYIGKGLLRILTSHINAFFWVIRNVKSGDTVITYNFPPIYAVPLLIKKIFIKYRLIVEYEDFYNKDDKRHYIFGPFEKFGIYFANAFIASSVGMFKYIKEKRSNPPIIINGGYFEDIVLTTKVENNNDLIKTTNILYSGTLDKERGIMDLLKLFQSNKTDKFTLTISGSGPLENQIREISALDSRIQYVGLLNDEKYNNLILNTDVCVNPQWTTITVNFPSKITIYLSYGKIVLSTKLDSLVNSPFNVLLNFYDEGDDDGFWRLLFKIRENLIHSQNNTANRINKFKEIIKKQDKALIDMLVK